MAASDARMGSADGDAQGPALATRSSRQDGSVAEQRSQVSGQDLGQAVLYFGCRRRDQVREK